MKTLKRKLITVIDYVFRREIYSQNKKYEKMAYDIKLRNEEARTKYLIDNF